MSDRRPFEGGVEYDRVTLAYWHQADPALSPKIRTLTQGLIDRVPNPVPDGQSVRAVLRCHLSYLSQSVMPWFAAQVILAAMNKKRARSLALPLHVSLR